MWSTLLIAASALTGLFYLPQVQRESPSDLFQIRIVTLFGNQTLGLETQFLLPESELLNHKLQPCDYHSIHFIESIFEHPPSFYLVGWYPHPALTYSLTCNDSIAYPIDQTPNPGSHERLVSPDDIYAFSQTRTINYEQYIWLMSQIHKQVSFSTINWRGYNPESWTETIFQLDSIVQNDQNVVFRIVRNLVYLLSVNLDACFYWFPKILLIFNNWVIEWSKFATGLIFEWSKFIMGLMSGWIKFSIWWLYKHLNYKAHITLNFIYSGSIYVIQYVLLPGIVSIAIFCCFYCLFGCRRLSTHLYQ